MCFVKTNPDGGAGRAAGCDLGGALKGKNWEKIGRKQGEFFPPINISAGEWEKFMAFGVVWGEYFPLR